VDRAEALAMKAADRAPRPIGRKLASAGQTNVDPDRSRDFAWPRRRTNQQMRVGWAQTRSSPGVQDAPTKRSRRIVVRFVPVAGLLFAGLAAFLVALALAGVPALLLALALAGIPAFLLAFGLAGIPAFPLPARLVALARVSALSIARFAALVLACLS